MHYVSENQTIALELKILTLIITKIWSHKSIINLWQLFRWDPLFSYTSSILKVTTCHAMSTGLNHPYSLLYSFGTKSIPLQKHQILYCGFDTCMHGPSNIKILPSSRSIVIYLSYPHNLHFYFLLSHSYYTPHLLALYFERLLSLY